MQFNTNMPAGLYVHFIQEVANYRFALGQKEFQLAWHHLERAHILGQAYPFEHTQIHWEMLKFGIQIKNRKEVIGQIPRLLVGGVKSFVGNIPVGNTGGANVPPLKPMEIPEELKSILDAHKIL